MVFASGLFLFLFLPVTFLGTFILRNKPIEWRNFFLLGMSAVFYLKSGIREFLLLMLSVLVNYLAARCIAHWKDRSAGKKAVLTLTVLYNIGMLFVFKYFSFVTQQLNEHMFKTDFIYSIALPLGISFYTFQALSYVVDVYRDTNKLEKNIINVALYISFFSTVGCGTYCALGYGQRKPAHTCFGPEKQRLYQIYSWFGKKGNCGKPNGSCGR